MSENLRRYPRQEIQIEVELRFLDDDPRMAITRDMSEGGLFMRIKDTDHYPMGEMLSVRFKNPLNLKNKEKLAKIKNLLE